MDVLVFDGLFFIYDFIFYEKVLPLGKGEIRGEGKHSELRRPFPLPTPLPSGHAVVLRCGDVNSPTGCGILMCWLWMAVPIPECGMS